jgi:hypothetical protein
MSAKKIKARVMYLNSFSEIHIRHIRSGKKWKYLTRK